MLNPRLLSVIALGLTTIAVSAAPGDIQGNVIGPNHKPVSGAKVTLQRKDAKSAPITVNTDAQGRYVFSKLALTGAYNLTVAASGMAATSAQNVKPLSDGAVRIDFNLKQQTGNATAAAPSKPKAKQMVWVPATTGTNLGGHWVEVGTEQTAESSNFENVEHKSAAAVAGMQGNTR